MPASEQTWYDQKIMHIIFGATALVMTIATLWLLAKDHNRQWKSMQLENRKKSAWIIQARHDSLADQFSSKLENFDKELREAESEPVDPADVEEFESSVKAENERLSLPESDFSALENQLQKVNEAATKAAEVRDRIEGTDEGAAENTDAKAQVDPQDQRELLSSYASTAVAREKLLSLMTDYIDEARRREKTLAGTRKFVAANRTAAVSALGLMVSEGVDEKRRAEKQKQIDEYSKSIAELTVDLAAANNYRRSLEEVVASINDRKAVLLKERSTMETELSRLSEQAQKTQPTGFSRLGEWITRWPILNALYSGNVQIDQIWLPDLTINYNFSQAARFDRCKTCHQDISTTAAGRATEPAFPTLPESKRDLTIKIPTPEEAPADGSGLNEVYGLELTNDVIVGAGEHAIVHYALPGSLAAQAGLESGDIIEAAGGIPVDNKESVANYLLTLVSWGEPAELKVRRGLDHPFTSHPRLDLYLTDSSPHPEKVMGCTVCHDGQGSGTEFKWTSHTPNDFDQQDEWLHKYGWFDNHHWIFPMKPQRFVESNCLKCHYDKGSLEPSERFPEPPAPKLVEGWTLVEQYGCYGCHEINGFDGPDKRVGPDIRLEPNYSEVAAQLLRDDTLNDQEKGWATTLRSHPDDSSVRHSLFDALKSDAKLASSSQTSDEARLSAETHKLADGLKDVEVPGTYRKVGPSLRYLKSKVEYDWLYSWIKLPSNFRPSTRMPQFFGLWEHLGEDPEELDKTKRYEAVEIHALSEYLLANSSEFKYLTPPKEVTETASAERGKWLFESRGCLACHSHEAFPGIAANQGPDLSRVGAKLNNDIGKKWLYSWIKQPHDYNPRTKMPELYLTPIEEKDAQNQSTGKVTDPAADIRAFLLGTPSDWKPTDVPARDWSGDDLTALADLAQEWLSSDAIPAARAEEFVKTGIPDSLEPKLKADEKLLLKKNFANRTQQLQDFVARRTISKYGCFGCHDIPGFEDAKPIGTGLADWGRKDSSKLAFENIHAFLSGSGDPHADKHSGDAHGAEAHDGGGHGHLNPGDYVQDGISYFLQSLVSHSRDGFLWQKLRMPRSFDYKTTKNKGYNERLRMPKFPFTEDEREAVMTFVLGLVSEPPADKFVYHPDARRAAEVAGRHVLDQFNCAGCHTLKMEEWKVAFTEGEFESPIQVQDFPFLEKHFSQQEIAESLVIDSGGRMHTTLNGLPVMSEETGEPLQFDIDGLELEPDDDESDPYYRFTLWRDTLIAGEAWNVGIQDPMVPASRTDYGPAEGKAFPAWGGDLARYLYPKVIEHAKLANPQVKGSEAWGWLPPPLMQEGEKVQPDWLHGFLMDPTEIRPAVVMRMPNFHMSSEEASKLVNYFAASSGAEYPYEYNRSQRGSYIAEKEAEHPERLSDAMNIVVNGNYCVKCHAVEDFYPQGDPTTFGPNLADVHSRLRPEFIRNWVANPKRILPYTGMPVNIPFNADAPHLGGVAQNLFPGTSLEQLTGLVDLLLNFDTYAKRQTEVTPMVKAAADANAPPTSDADGDTASLE
ncbi:PDZ domain-containing protein [Bythopirellula goksoeyrii]|uniref:Cytochrome c n=1 Tax=Bythopirellula goksoeyrii TaxID=1400387 RepID=A0A5B9QH57_9BACT|nr:PDZ domain-containing protein [Bythopirellula goksoeyrii]QEG36985.1 Cytochrome c [Bythopirellula goksoeyrii]